MTDSEEDPIICYCYQVRRSQIIKAIEENDLHTVAEVRKFTRASSGCGSCRPEVEELLDEYQSKKYLKVEKEKTRTIPKNVYKVQEPVELTVLSNKVIATTDGLETCHLIFRNPDHLYPFFEGQSLGVLPPGVDAKGRQHQLRLYSIASSQAGDLPNEASLSLCVKRVVYKDEETKQPVKGVCSNYLCDLKPGDTIKATGPVGQFFLLPENPAANLILIATGTGIAPFRAFWKNLFDVNRTVKFTGNVYLFLGCPYSESLLYKDELDALSEQYRNFHVRYAISREQKNENGSKRYVHHAFKKDINEIYPLLSSYKTYVYLCGLKGMEKGVLEVLERASEVRRQNWDTLFKKMKIDEKRWAVEVY